MKFSPPFFRKAMTSEAMAAWSEDRERLLDRVDRGQAGVGEGRDVLRVQGGVELDDRAGRGLDYTFSNPALSQASIPPTTLNNCVNPWRCSREEAIVLRWPLPQMTARG